MKTIQHSLLPLLLLLSVATGCDATDSGTDKNVAVEGLWQAQSDASLFLAVDPSQVSSYEFLPDGTLTGDTACYFVQDFTVVRVEGQTYSLHDPVFDVDFDVTMTRRGDVLTTVMTIDGSANTVRYNRTTTARNALQPVCVAAP